MATKRAQFSGAAAPIVIMIVLTVAVIFYVISVPPAERERLLGNLTVSERTALDVSPGLITGATEAAVQKIYKTLPTATVDNSPQPETRALSTQLTIFRGLTKEEIGNFTFDVASKDKLGYANVNLLVTERIGDGSLIAAVNGKVVFSGKVEVGQEARIALPIDSIIQGTNSLNLYVSSPGIKFWQKNSYTFTNVNLVLASYTEAKATQVQTFSLTSSELAGIKSAKLTASIKQTSEASAELKLMLNGVEIYKATPSQVTSLSIDLPTSLLKSTNTLQWSVGKDGAYSILLGQVSLATSKIEAGEVKSYTFTLTSSEASNLKFKKLGCEMTLTRLFIAEEEEDTPPPPPTGGAVATGSTIDVRINGFLRSYSFADGTVTDDICSDLHSGSNTVSLSAEKDIFIDRLLVKIKTK